MVKCEAYLCNRLSSFFFFSSFFLCCCWFVFTIKESNKKKCVVYLWHVSFASKLSPCLTLLSWSFLEEKYIHGLSLSVMRNPLGSCMWMPVLSNHVKRMYLYCPHRPFSLPLGSRLRWREQRFVITQLRFEVPTRSKMTYLRSDWFVLLVVPPLCFVHFQCRSYPC